MTFTQEELAGRIDFRAFYASEGVEFRGRRARCPFHEDRTPSLSIDFDRGLFNCRPCGFGGDPVSFLQRRRSLTAEQAIAELRRRYGTPAPPKRAWTIRDASGTAIAEHRRLDEPDGGKRFIWSRGGENGLGGLKTAT